MFNMKYSTGQSKFQNENVNFRKGNELCNLVASYVIKN